jgi:4-aminobutyrate aminotransferase-like enzyme
LLPNVNEIGLELSSGLEDLRERHPIIAEVRGRGLMIGVQLSEPGHAIQQACLERGLLLNCTHDTVLRLLPPYILTRAQARQALAILDEVLP